MLPYNQARVDGLYYGDSAMSVKEVTQRDFFSVTLVFGFGQAR